MRKYFASAILAAAVMAVPVVGFATISQAPLAAAKKEATKTDDQGCPDPRDQWRRGGPWTTRCSSSPRAARSRKT